MMETAWKLSDLSQRQTKQNSFVDVCLQYLHCTYEAQYAERVALSPVGSYSIHHASDYTTRSRARTPRVRRNKHFRHSPTSSIVKHKHALRKFKHSNSYLWDRDCHQASARTSAESEKACQRKTTDRADGMREKKCPFPSMGLEPVPLGYAPIMLPITPREQARLASVETNTSDTHPPAPS